jgi:hypothetical protein
VSGGTVTPIHADRRPPRVSIDLVLEMPVQIAFVCETYEDEVRLRAWLRRTPELGDLIANVLRILDDLDEQDAAA